MQGMENVKLPTDYTNFQTSAIKMHVLFLFERWNLSARLHTVLA